MNPYVAQIALGLTAVLVFRSRFLRSLAVAFTHYTVQTLLIALVGEGPATGAAHLPLLVQLVFFPITMAAARFGIPNPAAALLNSGFAGLVLFVALPALDRNFQTPDVRSQARPTAMFFDDPVNAVASIVVRQAAKPIQTTQDLPAFWRGLAEKTGSGSVDAADAKRSAVNWLNSLKANTTEMQSIQDGGRYSVSVSQILWGIWTIAIAARGFLGVRRLIYALCLVPPDPSGRIPGRSLQAALDGRRMKWVPVASFSEEDGRRMLQAVCNIVQVAPRDQWDPLIMRELHARVNRQQDQGSERPTCSALTMTLSPCHNAFTFRNDFTDRRRA